MPILLTQTEACRIIEMRYSLKKSIFGLGAIALGCLLVLIGCKNEVSVEDPVMKEAERINYKCPMMVDQITRMDSASVVLPDSVFRFNYTLIDQKRGSIDVVGLVGYLEPKFILYAQDHASMAIQRSHRLTLSFLYRDMYGEFVMEIIIKPEQYIRKQAESEHTAEIKDHS